jgi:oligoribonuclease
MFFLWVDCEMTGLEYDRDHILEIACIITDGNMNQLAEYHRVIHQSSEILASMGDWCTSTHTDSGLLNLVRKSTDTYITVEKDIVELLTRNVSKNNTYIVGNSVYNDLIFIKKYMPRITDILHYRIFDISTFKILASKKNVPPFVKSNTHTAINDIRESIAEYLYYEKVLFKE